MDTVIEAHLTSGGRGPSRIARNLELIVEDSFCSISRKRARVASSRMFSDAPVRPPFETDCKFALDDEELAGRIGLAGEVMAKLSELSAKDSVRDPLRCVIAALMRSWYDSRHFE